MNLPRFNFSNIALIADTPRSVHGILEEQRRVCGSIDARLSELETEFCSMVDEMNTLKQKLETARGFFKKWGIRTQMVALCNRIDINRDMRYELVCARIKRTYA